MRIRRESSPSPDDRDEWLTDDEHSKVELWRLHVLSEAGYSLGVAQRLAMSAAVDIHIACELLKGGCSEATAAEILL